MPERLLTLPSTPNFDPLSFKHYEVLTGPDLGGRQEITSPIENTVILATPYIEPNSSVLVEEATTHQQETTKKPDDYDTQIYLAEVNRIQKIFDRIFGKSLEISNYNPVLEIAKYSTLQTEEQRQQFPTYENNQIATALRERYQSATSVVYYEIDDDNKLRNRDLPTQPFEEILKNGIEYYQSLDSPDVSRMEKEREGILQLQTVLTNPETPQDTKVTVISGPSSIEGTIFKENFLDVYAVTEDPVTKKRLIRMTRFASDKNYEQYKKEVTNLQADYFDQQEGSIDEWLLSHPLVTSEITAQNKSALKEEQIQQILTEGQHRITHLITTICENMIDPEKVAVAINAVLNGADRVWKKFQSIENKVISFVSKIRQEITPIFKNIADEINWLGHQVVRAVRAGCGMSGGFSIGKGLRGALGMKAGSFGGGGREGIPGMCGECGQNNGDDHYHCHECSKKYASERSTSEENRTKQCGCGAKFGC